MMKSGSFPGDVFIGSVRRASESSVMVFGLGFLRAVFLSSIFEQHFVFVINAGVRNCEVA
jgi:hypothetical protein